MIFNNMEKQKKKRIDYSTVKVNPEFSQKLYFTENEQTRCIIVMGLRGHGKSKTTTHYMAQQRCGIYLDPHGSVGRDLETSGFITYGIGNMHHNPLKIKFTDIPYNTLLQLVFKLGNFQATFNEIYKESKKGENHSLKDIIERLTEVKHPHAKILITRLKEVCSDIGMPAYTFLVSKIVLDLSTSSSVDTSLKFFPQLILDIKKQMKRENHPDWNLFLMVALDEAHEVCISNSPCHKNWDDLTRASRKFMIVCVFISQNFMTLGIGIRRVSADAIIHKLNDMNDIRHLIKKFCIDPSYAELIKRLPIGTALFTDSKSSQIQYVDLNCAQETKKEPMKFFTPFGVGI